MNTLVASSKKSRPPLIAGATLAIAALLLQLTAPDSQARPVEEDLDFRVGKIGNGDLHETREKLATIYKAFKEDYETTLATSADRKTKNGPLLILRKIEDKETPRNLYLTRSKGALTVAEFPSYLTFKPGDITPRVSLGSKGYVTVNYTKAIDGPMYDNNFKTLTGEAVDAGQAGTTKETAPEVIAKKLEEEGANDAEQEANELFEKKKKELAFFDLPLRPWHVANIKEIKESKAKEIAEKIAEELADVQPRDFRVYTAKPEFKYWLPGAPAKLDSKHFKTLLKTLGTLEVTVDETPRCQVCGGFGQVKDTRATRRSSSGKVACKDCKGVGNIPTRITYTVTP